MKWTQTNRWHWTARFDGDKHDAIIHMLDAVTYSVVRNGKYLGSERTLTLAQARAQVNKLSKSNLIPGVVKVGGEVIGHIGRIKKSGKD